MNHIYDMAGVGFGPANIALAIYLEEQAKDQNIIFLEGRGDPTWQSEMLIEGSDMQNNPIRDLVTPRNPRSKYTFINYLFEHDRLLDHLNLGLEFPLRVEYADYISWVAKHFDRWTRYNQRVASVAIEDRFVEPVYRIGCGDGTTYLARSLVVATGRTKNVPEVLEPVLSDRAFHLTEYISKIGKLENPEKICVVGGSQSAVELTLDLAKRFPSAEIINLIRGFSYRLKDTSPFSEESIMPEFIKYYYEVDRTAKDELDRDLRFTNYSAADMDVLRELYVMIYHQKLRKRQRVFVRNHQHLQASRLAGDKVELTVQQKHTKAVYKENFDAVVIATGFKNFGNRRDDEPILPLLKPIAERVKFNDQGCVHVNFDYSLAAAPGTGGLPPTFLYNLCEHTHGIADAGSFSLISLRAKKIGESLASLLTGNRAENVRSLRYGT